MVNLAVCEDELGQGKKILQAGWPGVQGKLELQKVMGPDWRGGWEEEEGVIF